MDFLDVHSDFGNAHAISYELPRFYNVKTADFLYVSGIDCDRSSVDGNMNYGVVSVSAPYSLRVLFFMHIQILFHCVFVFV
jgi:hypothetical protein